MIEQFEDPRVKVPPPLSQRDPLCKTVQPPKNENNDTEEKLASVQHTLVILSPPLSSSCVLQPLTRNSTKPPRARGDARVCASLDKHNEKLALLWRTPCWTRLAGNKEVTRTSPDGECSALRGEGRGGCRSNGEKGLTRSKYS